jgi:hypothetical protein
MKTPEKIQDKIPGLVFFGMKKSERILAPDATQSH